jgi:hypothetical protein
LLRGVGKGEMNEMLDLRSGLEDGAHNLSREEMNDCINEVVIVVK